MCGRLIYKVGKVIEVILKEIVDVFKVILTGQNIILLVSTISIFAALTKRLVRHLNERQDELLTELDTRLKDIEKETLRIQILTGIDSHRLSRSELLYFFDKYKALGGNSFVEDRVHIYLKELEDKGEM